MLFINLGWAGLGWLGEALGASHSTLASPCASLQMAPQPAVVPNSSEELSVWSYALLPFHG